MYGKCLKRLVYSRQLKEIDKHHSIRSPCGVLVVLLQNLSDYFTVLMMKSRGLSLLVLMYLANGVAVGQDLPVPVAACDRLVLDV